MDFSCALILGDMKVPKVLSLEEIDERQEIETRKTMNKWKDSLQKRPENINAFYKKYSEELLNLPHIDTRNRKKLYFLVNINLIVSHIYKMLFKGYTVSQIRKMLPKAYTINKIGYDLWRLERNIIEPTNRAIGYWGAKMEDYGPVIEGAIKRHEKSERKEEELLKLCEEYGIYNAKDFRKNKPKRNKFIEDAKKILDVSERRILDYLKIIELSEQEIITKPREKG